MMNARNWPGHWQGPYPNPYEEAHNPHLNSGVHLNHNPNPTTSAGQNPGMPYYNYGYAPYGYPSWGYYAYPSNHWPMPSQGDQIQTSSATPMMPPNAVPYQSNLKEEIYEEMWESPQSPQSPWIRAYAQHENKNE